MNPDSFVQNVKKQSKLRGVPPTTACSESGAGKNLLREVLNGKTPGIDRVEKLAAYLGCTVSELIGEQPHPGREAAEPVTVPEDPLIREIMERVHDLTPDQKRLYLAQLRALQDADK